MNYVIVQLGGLPIQLACFSNGFVSFQPITRFNTIVDYQGEGVQAIISEQDMCIGVDTEIEYGYLYDYKEMPELLAYLASLNMIMPQFKKPDLKEYNEQ